MQQEIADLKSQLQKLQNAQRRITKLMEKQFTLENLKSNKYNRTPFYTGFNCWDALEAVYYYLGYLALLK